MTQTVREGWPDDPAFYEDIVFMDALARSTMTGEKPWREDILRLLAFKPDSPQAGYLGMLGRIMARVVADNTATIWSGVKEKALLPEPQEGRLSQMDGLGLKLAHLVELLGQEYSDEEIADVLLTALESGAEIMGVLRLVNVPGTPHQGQPMLSDERLAQITAIIRVCGGIHTPYVCVHPPMQQAVDWGANVLIVENTARDESNTVEQHEFRLSDAVKMFSKAGYRVEQGALR